MKLRSIIMAFGCCLVLGEPAFAQDVEGASDHPDFGRFEGTKITLYEEQEYAAQRMYTNVAPETFEDFEGAVTRYVYSVPEKASILQVLRSYEQKLADDDFEVLVSCINSECGRGNLGRLRATVWRKLLNNEMSILTVARENVDGSVHAQITIAPNWINVNVVQSADFENKMLDAAAMKESISDTGHVALEDIYFDVNKAVLLPESSDALGEMAKLLKDNPGMEVYIVGHTDNTGTYEANLDLSRRRAEAVVSALSDEHGIDAGRIVPTGVGPLAPVASNSTSEGQAKNRRVEIVQR